MAQRVLDRTSPHSGRLDTSTFLESTMFGRRRAAIHTSCRYVLSVVAMSILFAIAAAAQDSAPATPNADGPATLTIPKNAPADTRVMTLPEAQQRAQVANAALARIGE